jgi:hypothetical protein
MVNKKKKENSFYIDFLFFLASKNRTSQQQQFPIYRKYFLQKKNLIKHESIFSNLSTSSIHFSTNKLHSITCLQLILNFKNSKKTIQIIGK